jgi:hypothetical protein
MADTDRPLGDEPRRGQPGQRDVGDRLLRHAILAVVVAGLLTASRTSDKWVLAYVIYGLIALFFVVIPNAAVLLKRDLPYSTLLCTVDDLRRRWHPAAMVILAGLVVLLIHLAFYPWPHVVQPPTTNSA